MHCPAHSKNRLTFPTNLIFSRITFNLLADRDNGLLDPTPDGIRLHPVFHISLLEKASQDELDNGPIMDSIEVLPIEEEYEVEEIRAIRVEGNERQYLIKWKNYGEEHNSWEPKGHLEHSQTTLQQFHRDLGLSTKGPTRRRK